ncbi:hypothetical protein DB30_03552 [Enhygromyxa salina]|uniref:Outer membrane protein beta-barrel domain-containing protein n=2 Tax=Enhygromyxa salina TaxID=215803 RepID=A0A0C1ZI74_9BACT|nr:hypothetical protein DB30_03552 [Enhygromyxa salina]
MVGALALSWASPKLAAASAPAPASAVEGPSEPAGSGGTEASTQITAPGAAAPEQPPRISGTYFGMTIWPALSWAYSPNLPVPHSMALPGGGGSLRLGQAVFPWMTIGLDASGGFYFGQHTFFMKGGLLVELGFYPVPRYPFSFRGGFGFGAGLITDDRTDERGGVGGPRFMGSVRYEFFPNAERTRPRRPGGWVVGPELGWRGFTPAAKGRPMSNTLLLGIWFGYYWGR